MKPAGADSDDESLVPSPLQAPARVSAPGRKLAATAAEPCPGDGKASYILEAALTRVRVLEHVQKTMKPIDRKNFGRPASMD